MEERQRVQRLLKRIASKGELGKTERKEVKHLCQSNEERVLVMVHDNLAKLMRRQQSQIRLVCLQIADMIFLRSHVFRELIVKNLRSVLKPVLDDPLPPPIPLKLRREAAKIVRNWAKTFGNHFPKLEVACQHLKLDENVDGVNDNNAENEERERNVWLERVRRIELELRESRSELDECLKEVESCIDLLVPKPGHFGFNQEEEQQEPREAHQHKGDNSVSDELVLENVHADAGDEEMEEEEGVQREHGLVHRHQSLQIDLDINTNGSRNLVTLTEDNAALIEVLRSRVNLIRNRLLPRVTAWSVVLDRATHNVSQNLVTEVRRWKQILQEVLDKALELNVDLQELKTSPDDDEEDDDDDKDFIEVGAEESSTASSSISAAPSVWTCRHPLPSGRLCPRQDLVRCPLHGRIIARNSNGDPRNPSEVTESKESVPEWQDPRLLAELKAKTGVDLTMPKKGQRRIREGGVKSIKQMTDTPRKRLEKKVFKRNKAQR